MEGENNEMNNDEMVNVDVMEFSLDEEDIDELIEKLQELKNTKTNFSFDIDEENELVIHYDNGEEDEE